MQLQLSTWPEVERYLETSKAILIPIGSTEQHGPNGFVGTDALCPEVLAKEVGDQTGALVGPTISVGMAQHHLGFPGSITLKPTTLIAYIRDYVTSLERHGFERFYFLNGHGGNIATVTAAFSEIHAESSMGHVNNRPTLVFKLHNWWDSSEVMAISRDHFGAKEGSHATCSEVSLTYFAYPDHIKQVEMTPEVAPNGPIRDAADYRRRFPDGRIGSAPQLATPEIGEKLFKAASAKIASDWQAFAA